MDGRADQFLQIADDKSGDAMRDRLRLDTRKWLMSKIAPTRWGDRTIHIVNVHAGGQAIVGNVSPAPGGGGVSKKLETTS